MSDNHILLWEKCRNFISDNLTPQQFAAWFGSISSASFDNGELRLNVPSSFFVEQLEERYLGLLETAIQKVYGDNVVLYYCYNTVKDDPQTAVRVRTSEMSSAIMAGKRQAANPFIDEQPQTFDSQLNPRYNFENYCAGSSNKIARAIAQSIADDPSNKTFNPLFIFGPTGVGKTHLIQAIGIRVKEKRPDARVLYVTARLFQSQYTAANHKGKINNFFHFYQSIDTLIIDDIQDLAGKPETQNTFFHIFNQLHQNNRQIIMSSDCAPSEMDGFEERLLSRFKWGAAAQLEKPDFDLRRNVLIKKAQQDGLNISDEIIDYVAQHVTDSIRELEGVIVSLVAHATVLNTDITLSLAHTVVANAIKIKRSKVNFEVVTSAVSSYYNISPDDIFTKTRKRNISDARQMVMYLSNSLANMSFKSIGTKLGRSHATVLYACHNITERVPLDATLRNDISAIKHLIDTNAL